MTPIQDNSEARPSRWRATAKRFAPLAGLVAVAVVAYRSGLPHMLTPEAIGREQAGLQAAAASSPLLVLSGFAIVYAVLTGAGLPVALMLSLLAGATFGLWIAAPLVLIGAAGGALLTYAAARSAFAPWLLRRAEHDVRLQRVIAGFGRSAFTYVLTLRLIPMAPFALVNLAAGLAAVPLRAYMLATLIGGTPSALIYTGLGAGLGAALGSEHSLQQALHSPRVIVPLAALALLAFAPVALQGIRRRRGLRS